MSPVKRIFGLLGAFVLAALLAYISRFWIFDLWARDGLFGIKILTPRGGILGNQLRGTALAPFALLLWAVGAFLLLTVVQAVVNKLRIYLKGDRKV